MCQNGAPAPGELSHTNEKPELQPQGLRAEMLAQEHRARRTRTLGTGRSERPVTCLRFLQSPSKPDAGPQAPSPGGGTAWASESDVGVCLSVSRGISLLGGLGTNGFVFLSLISSPENEVETAAPSRESIIANKPPQSPRVLPCRRLGPRCLADPTPQAMPPSSLISEPAGRSLRWLRTGSPSERGPLAPPSDSPTIRSKSRHLHPGTPNP